MTKEGHFLTSNACEVNCGLEGKESESSSDCSAHPDSQRHLPEVVEGGVHAKHEAHEECEDEEQDEIPGSFSSQF